MQGGTVRESAVLPSFGTRPAFRLGRHLLLGEPRQHLVAVRHLPHG